MRLGLPGRVAYNAAVNAAPARPRLLTIVNTAAGAGRTGRRWPALARELGRCGLAYDPAFTRAAGDAARLARQAAVDGYAAVVAVGGDGTINEVLNGLMAAAAAGYPPPALGVLPSGTAQDFARSVGIPLEARAAVAYLARAQPRPLDVGRIRFQAGAVHYFANYAGTGFDALVAAKARAWRHLLRGAAPYVVGFFAVLRGYVPPCLELRLDDTAPRRVPRVTLLILANGPNYAGYLRIAPQARLDDGLLDLIVVRDVGRLELLLHLPLAISGRHLHHPKVTALRARSVDVAAGTPLPVQSDGEVVGTLPARFDVLPGALRLLQA
jgi:diacylglycerol kinase (ATP)